MSKTTGLLAILVLMAACNDSGRTEARIDSLGREIDTTARQVWDSGKVKARQAGEKIKKGVNSLKDRLDTP